MSDLAAEVHALAEAVRGLSAEMSMFRGTIDFHLLPAGSQAKLQRLERGVIEVRSRQEHIWRRVRTVLGERETVTAKQPEGKRAERIQTPATDPVRAQAAAPRPKPKPGPREVSSRPQRFQE